MQNRNKHYKNLKIYNNKHKSFYDLKQKWFFGIFNLGNGKIKIQTSVIELLTVLVRDLNVYDTYSKQEFFDYINDNVEIVELQRDISLSKRLVNKLSNELYNIFLNRDDFFRFRGDLLEFLVVYTLKPNKHSLYHEPRFYHKRKNLITRNFRGKNCLVDIVEVNQADYKIRLFECKANYNNHVRNQSFIYKLDYIEHVEFLLKGYKTAKEDFVKVKKHIISIADPIRPMPGGYNNYEVKNLLDVLATERL